VGAPLPALDEASRQAALAGDEEAMGRWLRLAGAEFGTTTGRPRRTGWLDMVAVRHAVRVSGLNGLAITKLDVLDGIPTLRIGVGYEIRGVRTERMPSRVRDLADARLVYEELPGWSTLGEAETFQDLPPQAQAYVKRMSELAGVPVRVLSVGSRRSQSMILPE
jgi:adenylosuccinate synthase